MDVQEIVQTIEGIQTNASAGFFVLIYYLVVYWQRIKDGLGLSQDKKYDLDRVEKNYQLLKLRIEIEKIKKDSGLDNQLLQQLESEMQGRLEKRKGHSFTAAQKFFAIPLIIFVTLLSFLLLQAANAEKMVSANEVILRTVFTNFIIIIGFWGIPVLQKQKKGWLRTFFFMIYWFFTFFLIGYILISIFAINILGVDFLSSAASSFILLCSMLSSLVLGLLGKLPFMGVSENK